MCVYPGTHISFKKHLVKCPTYVVGAEGLYELISEKINLGATIHAFNTSSLPFI